MSIESLFGGRSIHTPWYLDERNALAEDPFNDDAIYVRYDRRDFFPLTRWLSDHHGEEITHRKMKEFKHLSLKVREDLTDRYPVGETKDWVWSHFMDSVLYPLQDCIERIWDLGGTLKMWIFENMVRFICGHTGVDLPETSMETNRRERDYRGGMSAVEMGLANFESGIMSLSEGEEVPYDEDDIDQARETGQGEVDYEFNVESYL